MALLNVTPTMISNISPSPYVVSSSSQYSNFYEYLSFDKYQSGNGMCWHSAQSKVEGEWLSIDFSKEIMVSAFSIANMTHASAYTTTGLKSFKLQGCNDNNSWIDIYYAENEPNWASGETRTYTFEKCSFRYFRIYIITNYGYNYACLDEFNLYIDSDLIGNISHKNMSLTYQIPMNTTTSILAKTNDTREGLLGMANDPENYGDLYVVGKDGRSHLTKSGIKSETIFDGSIEMIGDFNLSKSIYCFKKIVVYGDFKSNTSYIYKTSTNINVEDIKGYENEFIILTHYLSTGNVISSFTFTENSIKVNSSKVRIYKIVGIY